MATVNYPDKAKLVIGILTENQTIEKAVFDILLFQYGNADIISEAIPFEHSQYYDAIGKKLYKKLYSFECPIYREELTAIKLFTNSLEQRYLSENGERLINIDPGYITLSNLFLASCKEYYHRAYIGSGIYLENEYYYQDKAYRFWDWTYPDYKKDEYLDFFHTMRKIYKAQLAKRQ